MRLKEKQKKYILLSTFLLVIIICSFCLLNRAEDKTFREQDKLSEKQIASLRNKYPICGIEIPPHVSMRTPSLEEVKERVDTFIYCEVVGEMQTYSKKISTGYSKLDEKEANKGLSNVYDFYEHTISIIDDTENIYSKGEKITIASNADFMSYNPQLKEGMKFVIPVKKYEDVEGRHGFLVQGMYYVTDDGYAISAFDESASKTKSFCNGIKVEQLLQELKK